MTIIILKKINRMFCLIFLLLCTQVVLATPTQLSLSSYLNQVKNCNKGVNGACLIAQGACARTKEGNQVWQPKLFAEGQYLRNVYDPNNSPIVGSNNSLQSYQLGISQETPYGVKGKLYYNYQHQNINGVSPFSPLRTTTTSPVMELSLPLARNFAGRESRAGATLVNQQACLTHLTEALRIKLQLAEAEAAYWHLAITRNIVALRIDSLCRAQKLEQWVSQKANVRLAGESDVLEARTAVMAKQLDIQAAQNDEAVAALNFNRLRGSNQPCVVEQLSSYSYNVAPCLPAHYGPREDLKAAQAEEKIAVAQAQLGIEKTKPEVELFASYALNGNNPSTNEAISQSFSLDYPSTAVGVRLSIPLDQACMRHIRSGYRKELCGAKQQLCQKTIENKVLWEQLQIKLKNASQRFNMAMQLEKMQQLKLQAERIRLSNGKTTTYQFTQMQQDYDNAQLARLLIQDEILGLVTQLKTFGV